MQTIDVIVGGQYGSEAKGHVTSQVIQQYTRIGNHGRVINIRVAGPNAGHTVINQQGEKFAFRTLPVGAALGHEDIYSYIAPGSELDLEVLWTELDQLRAAKIPYIGRLGISGEVTILTTEHKERESDGDLVAKVGSTGKGIGAARAARAMRTAHTLNQLPEQVSLLRAAGVHIIEPAELYNNQTVATSQTDHQHLIIEGTQGYGLSTHYSGHYPQVTSSDCTAIDFLAMAQVQPWREGVVGMNIWVVARAYPIRVAGNSGPLKNETTWEELGLQPEKTTVTQKIRRVGLWDTELVGDAIRANGGRAQVSLALTMSDQVIPGVYGLDDQTLHGLIAHSSGPEREFKLREYLEHSHQIELLHHWVEDIVSQLEDYLGEPVDIGMVTTGPSTAITTDWVCEHTNPQFQWTDNSIEVVSGNTMDEQAEQLGTDQYTELDATLEEELNTDAVTKLQQWWMGKAWSEIKPLTAKMQEYGGMGRAIDLEEIGRGLTQSGVRTPAQMYGQPAQPHELQELGIYFYLLGKFARWTAAVAEGRPVSDDTLLDIGVYVRMVQRIRESGGWPQ